MTIDATKLNESEEVDALVDQASQWIAEALGVAPDLTPETLPLADAYLKTVVAELPAEDRLRRLDAVGTYFGEVARRHLNGRWALGRGGPTAWRIELASCFLHFSPVGMTGEALVGCESEVYDGTFATLDELHDDLAAALRQAPPLPEGEYYSLSGRIEMLTSVADFLVSLAITRAEKAEAGPPPTYSAADYRSVLGESEE